MVICRRPRRRRAAVPAASHGFTLIELLVAISVIALLIAVLLPALRQARITARKMQGLSNQRQIGIVAHVYASDFNDWMIASNVGARDPNTGEVVDLAWQCYLWRHYLNGDDAVLQDPQLEEEALFNPLNASEVDDLYGALTDASYVMNTIGPQPDASRGWGSSVPMTTEEMRRSSGWTGAASDSPSDAKLPVPLYAARLSSAIFITDHRAFWSNAGGMASGFLAGIQQWSVTDHGDKNLGAAAASRRKVGMHQPDDAFNALFGDGHARTVADRQETHEAWIAYVR